MDFLLLVCSTNFCSENPKDIFFKNLQKARETKTGDTLKEVSMVCVNIESNTNSCATATVAAGVAEASADDQR